MWQGRRVRALVALGLLLGIALGGAGATWSSFTKTASNDSNLVTAKRIFPGVRTVSAWKIDDASAGTAPVAKNDSLSYLDGITTSTKFGSTWSTSRFVDIDFQPSRPASAPITSASFNFTFAAGAAGDQACFYLELRRTSSMSTVVAGPFGSTTTPAGCVTGTTQQSFSTAITIPSAYVNDLTARLYVYESGGKAILMDRATITGTTYGDGFTMYEQRVGDQADGTAPPTYTTWSLLAQDTLGYASAANWLTTFSASRYLKLTFPPDFSPSGAIVTSVTLTNRYASSGGAGSGNACAYYEIYSSSGTLLGTHGSSTTPYSCSTGTTAVTDSISLPEVNTPAKLNGMYVMAYIKETGGKKSKTDWVKLDANYYLD